MERSAEHTYAVGDIVIAKPKWPTKPAFGIWTSDTELVKHGKPAKITGYHSNGGYSVQFDRDGDRTFHDCHWPIEADEIVGLETQS